MNALARVAIVIVVISVVDYVCSVAFDFFGVGFEVYGNYMLWFNAVILFAGVLPKKTGELFSKPSLE